jgi:CheY-like chemotaxis protein/predicted regulator of Ras-like GTPase activity (Roadblock/LC7/MglB family)
MASPFGPRRILLVDDEEALVWSLASRLSKVRPDDTFETANDGASALALMRERSFDLLVADIRMPGMNGIDLVLAARATHPQLPVVLMTAFQPDDIERLSTVPFTGLLEKPFEFERLLELMDRALARPKTGYSGAISAQTLPDIVQLYALSSTTGLLTIRHGDEVGEIWFEHGDIRHAVAGDERGDDAVYATMRWSGGDFSMRLGATSPEHSVGTTWQELVMESCRRIDERHRETARESRVGWTQSPPRADDLDLTGMFPDFEPSLPSGLESLAAVRRASPRGIEGKVSIKDSLANLSMTDGFLGAAFVDVESGMLLGQRGGGTLNLEIAAACISEVVRANRKAIRTLRLEDSVEDMHISLGKQYHLVRPLRTRESVFVYVVLDRSHANLAMARIAVADAERDAQV